ncbi:protein LTO1 homolog [Babylonia areolata]|uniref:protein LTO1 homolog n=1 Tax=Babylonia areolata TaxID=304850 RepID=UPI003FD3121A
MAAVPDTMDVVDDDFLDAVFMNESRCQDEGYQEGRGEGRRKGLEEGFRLGCQKGCEIGTELGFYLGYAGTIRQQAENSKNQQRVLKSVDNLVRLIEAFPLTDPKNPNLHDQVQAIRAKFKQITSLLDIRTEFKSAAEPQGSSF